MSDVINGVPRELLERALKADASIGANAIQLADGWKAMAELRALLTAQPQASAAQSDADQKKLNAEPYFMDGRIVGYTIDKDEHLRFSREYDSAAQSAPVGEREAWTSSKPIEPGAYWVRGNGLEADALVQMKLDDGELWCNLHMRTTEPDFGYGYSVEQLSDDFEWLGPLHVGAAWQRTQSAGVPDDAMVAVASAAYEREALAGATHEQAWHVALSEAIAAAPAQPAAQDQVEVQRLRGADGGRNE